jgi:tripartite-type tricarboxylate transporter receptor subunit TctC
MRRRFLTMLAACLFAAALAAPAGAQDFPTRPIRLVVPFGPGGGSDIVSRIIAQRLQEKLGQPVVVENRPGAGGIVGNDAIARAEPDGYTIGIMTAGQIIASVMRKQMPYDTLKAFDAISQVATAGLMIVARPDFPASDAAGVVAAAKRNPGKVSFAAPGFGATQHMAAVLFGQVANIDVLHVPFRTSPEAISSLQGGQVDVLFDTVQAVLGPVQSGALKAIGVTGKDRFPAVPNVPPAVDSGAVPGYDVTTWYGFFGPRGMPPAVTAKLNAAFNEIIAEPAIRERLTTAGVVVKGSTPEAFAKFLTDEHARWTAVREKAGIPQQ